MVQEKDQEWDLGLVLKLGKVWALVWVQEWDLESDRQWELVLALVWGGVWVLMWVLVWAMVLGWQKVHCLGSWMGLHWEKRFKMGLQFSNEMAFRNS